ncbi:ubiquinol-cytochrome-c reductase complex assembly factor 1-like [Python bivittatus]|uniref:Ubiquinol-cytochrome-c reductase complex assembly factor 1-like n=1 Tax=Python bivittatus TaxID=176946 RepID=A0A9F3W0M2_PYTBI|nr:ubiquinol-cytochrome-c reductase complex assembly factor 1-like [Python bivittatus]
MAALVRVVIHRTREPHWIALCSGLIQTTLAQQQWGRLLHGSLQRHNSGQLQLTKVCCGLIQSIRNIKQPNRTFHQTKVFRGSAQPSEEKVGTFTKIIEAMGFTGPLKYKKWVNIFLLKIVPLHKLVACIGLNFAGSPNS